ncbi:MAG: hypothetical protein AAGO57_04355 [Pseudomonadota bacterium]
MTVSLMPNPQQSRFVEVLTNPMSGQVFGNRLMGAGPGPQLVVAGFGNDAEETFDHLMSIPTLPWMRGRLILLSLDALSETAMEIDTLSPLGSVDRTMILPTDASSDDRSGDNARHVLRTMTELGMIAGRGVH